MSTRLLCPECHGDRFIVDDDNEEFNCDCCDARGWIVGEPDAEVTALRHAATAALVRWYLDTQEGK